MRKEVKIPEAMKISLLTLALTVFSTVSAGARPYALGDLNADNKVDFKDLHLFSLQWLEFSGCFGYSCANLDDVNGVDMSDFALLAANWRETALRCWMETVNPPTGSRFTIRRTRLSFWMAGI